MVDASRRGFFRGRPRPKAENRPPWALAEALFVDRCTRCNDCLSACPEHILVASDGGFPTVDFKRGACTFCGDCAAACQPLALVRGAGIPAWRYKAVVGPTCLPNKGVECRVCGDACEARALRFVPARGGIAELQVDTAACTGCGDCVAVCPVGAITLR